MNGDSCERNRPASRRSPNRRKRGAVYIFLNPCHCDDDVVEGNHLSAMGFNVHLS